MAVNFHLILWIVVIWCEGVREREREREKERGKRGGRQRAISIPLETRDFSIL